MRKGKGREGRGKATEGGEKGREVGGKEGKGGRR